MSTTLDAAPSSTTCMWLASRFSSRRRSWPRSATCSLASWVAGRVSVPALPRLGRVHARGPRTRRLRPVSTAGRPVRQLPLGHHRRDGDRPHRAAGGPESRHAGPPPRRRGSTRARAPLQVVAQLSAQALASARRTRGADLRAHVEGPGHRARSWGRTRSPARSTSTTSTLASSGSLTPVVGSCCRSTRSRGWLGRAISSTPREQHPRAPARPGGRVARNGRGQPPGHGNVPSIPSTLRHCSRRQHQPWWADWPVDTVATV